MADAAAPTPAPGVDFSRIPNEDLDHIVNGRWDHVSQPVLDYMTGKQTPRPTMGENPGPTMLDHVVAPFEAIPALATRAADAVIDPVARTGARVAAAATGHDDEAWANATSEWLRRGLYNPHSADLQAAGHAISSGVNTVMKPVGAAANAIESGAEKLHPGAAHAIEHGSGIVNDAVSSLPVAGAALDVARTAREAGEATQVARGGSEVAQEAGYRGLRAQSDMHGPGAQRVTDTLISHDAGLLPGQTPNVANVQNARAVGPGRVYDQMERTLPPAFDATSPGHQELQANIRTIGDHTSQLPRSPDVDALRQTMLEQPSMTREELFANIRQARERGANLLASEDPDKQVLGRAYNQLAQGYEDFAGRNIPANGVPLAQWQAARVQFAKNYLAEAALKGGEHFDPSVYARAAQNDSGLLSGGAKVVGDTYNALPKTGTNGVATAVGSVAGAAGGAVADHVLGSPGATHGVAPATGAIIGAQVAPAVRDATRRLFSRGNTDAAAAAPTNPRLSYFYQPDPEGGPPRMQLQPPAGNAGPAPPSQMPLGDMAQPEVPFNEHITMEGSRHTNRQENVRPSGLSIAGEGAGGPHTAAGGRAGDIALSDVLSHGVEQSPPAGLTAGPMGAPAQSGVPFTRNAAHEAGDLTLGDEAAGGPRENNADLPGVMSQGVPEGTLQRTPPNAARGTRDSIEFPSGAQTQSRVKPLGAKIGGGKQRGAVSFWGGLDEDEHPEPPARTATRSAASMTMDDFNNAYGRLGDEAVTGVDDNGSRGGPNSVEAQHRLAEEKANGNAPFEITPDGVRSEIAHTVDAVDQPARKGHIKVQVDPSDGKLKIVDRGGLNERGANGLLARYQARSKIGDELP